MLAITIVLFVVPHNQQIVTIQQFFTYRIPLFRNQNLNIEQNPSLSKQRLIVIVSSIQEIISFKEISSALLASVYPPFTPSKATIICASFNFFATLGIYVDAMYSCFDNSVVEIIPLCVAK